MEARFANMPLRLIDMDASVGAHHLRGSATMPGLIPARVMFAPIQRDKRTTSVIAEAVQRPTVKFVATKTADQPDLQAMHRMREALVSWSVRSKPSRVRRGLQAA
jgi:transposase